ncbi:hypothetical protein MNBD_GAMMA16-2023 [hydrothermal vent metagenome]|uniref:Cell division protein ZapA n=1 Tax=hydrothermal vent metagenome TaxID=652676 RepID=A0A3B0ZUU1_9ZZZZ
MSTNDSVAVTVKILEKEYHISCPPEEQESLIKATLYLNEKMNQTRESGRLVGVDRIAVMAAINIANELLQLKENNEHKEGENVDNIEHFSARLLLLQDKVDAALNNGQQIEL